MTRLFLLAQVFFCSVAAGQNFVVQAPSQYQRQILERAEESRKHFAIEFTGSELPPWPTPCVITWPAADCQRGNEGITSYEPGKPPRNMTMHLGGSPQHMIASILPHEVTHLILASHFGRTIPRWADEGIATCSEADDQQQKHWANLRDVLATRRGIPINQMLAMDEYPQGRIMEFYHQGYGMSMFFMHQGGPRNLLAMIGAAQAKRSWTDAVRDHYGFGSLAELQDEWCKWITAGSPKIDEEKRYQVGAVAYQIPCQPCQGGQCYPQPRPPTYPPPRQQPPAQQTPSTINIDLAKLSLYLIENHGDKIKGPKGDTGEMGPIGLTGLAGKDGKDGKDGLPGLNGTNGLPGSSGLSEADINKIADKVLAKMKVGLVVDGKPPQVIGNGEAFVLEYKRGKNEVVK